MTSSFGQVHIGYSVATPRARLVKLQFEAISPPAPFRIVVIDAFGQYLLALERGDRCFLPGFQRLGVHLYVMGVGCGLGQFERAFHNAAGGFVIA